MRRAWQGSGLARAADRLDPPDGHRDPQGPRRPQCRVAVGADRAGAAAGRGRGRLAAVAHAGRRRGAGHDRLARRSGRSRHGRAGSATTAGFAMSGTVLFSILTLIMAVALIRTALVSNRVTDLGAGIVFALLFLIVRWTSVIENLLWSGLLLVGRGRRVAGGRAALAPAGPQVTVREGVMSSLDSRTRRARSGRRDLSGDHRRHDRRARMAALDRAGRADGRRPSTARTRGRAGEYVGSSTAAERL